MSILREGERIGAYRIIRLLGEGGMGAVYEAMQEPLQRRVALKTLHPDCATDAETLRRFETEAAALSRLSHPSIVQVSDFGTTQTGTVYLVMEYLRGQSLAARLAALRGTGQKLPLSTTLQIAFQIADVMAIAHDQGIIHRDIKPANVMLVPDAVAPGGERVKLLDFGIAKLTDDQGKGGIKTATHQVIGTPAYMSPEQCAGAGGVDARTDVYALGCVLYELLTGRTPFVAEGAGQLIGMHLFQEPSLLSSLAPQIPNRVCALCHSFLQKDKSLRPSMSDAADALGRQLSLLQGGSQILRSRPLGNTGQDLPAPSTPTTLGQGTAQKSARRQRSQLLLFGSSVLLVVGSATLCYLLWGASQPDRLGSFPPDLLAAPSDLRTPPRTLDLAPREDLAPHADPEGGNRPPPPKPPTPKKPGPSHAPDFPYEK